MCGFTEDQRPNEAVELEQKTDTTELVSDEDTMVIDLDSLSDDEIEQALAKAAEFLFGPALDPNDPDTYLVVNTRTGQEGFEYSPAGTPPGASPTIVFETFVTPDGRTVAAVKFDAEEIAKAQAQLAEDQKFIDAGAPSGALLFTEAPLRALAEIATKYADAVAAANADAVAAGNATADAELVAGIPTAPGTAE